MDQSHEPGQVFTPQSNPNDKPNDPPTVSAPEPVTPVTPVANDSPALPIAQPSPSPPLPQPDAPVRPPTAPQPSDQPVAVVPPPLNANPQMPRQVTPSDPVTALPNKPKVKLPLKLFMALAVISIGSFSAYWYVFKNSNDSIETIFPSLSSDMSHEDLLNTSIDRMLSINGLSYDVDATTSESISYSGSAIYGFSENLTNLFSSFRYKSGDDYTEYEILILSDGFFFRVTDASDEDENEFMNKWILINDETTQNIGAGSEYLGFLLNTPSSWEIPILIGLDNPEFDVKAKMFSDGYYEIISSSEEEYAGQPAVKYDLSVDSQKASELVTSLYNQQQEIEVYPKYVRPGSFLSDSYWEEEPSAINFTLWVSTDDARLLAAQRTPSDEVFLSVQSGLIKYDNFKYQDIVIPSAPTDSIPFNQYWPGSGNSDSSDNRTIEERSDDTEIKSDINSTITQLEVYYADFGYYPNGQPVPLCDDIESSKVLCTLESLLPERGLDPDNLIHPNGASVNQPGGYVFTPLPAGCVKCESFIMSATLSNGDEYKKESLN